MLLLGDEAQTEDRFGPFGNSAILIQDSCTVCAERTASSEIILTQPMELLGDVGLVESHFGPFEDSICLGAR
jgi:hypothetical protein